MNKRMIAATTRYIPNRSEISFDLIDGEVILIHLKTGSYFNLENTGAWVWSLIVKGAEMGQILELLRAKYPDEPAIDDALDGFVKHLLSESLVLDAPEEANAQVPNPHPSWNNSELDPVFSPPVLNVFTDMQALLLLDPIHEVDESGWPASQSADEETGSAQTEPSSENQG